MSHADLISLAHMALALACMIAGCVLFGLLYALWDAGRE